MNKQINDKIDRLNRYFMEDHCESFQLIDGSGLVMISAPHSVEQTRNGKTKCAEPQTGVLALLLNEKLGCPIIYKTKNCNDDANYDKNSVYKLNLADYIVKTDIKLLIDLHQLSSSRIVNVNLGVANYNHVDNRQIPIIIVNEFLRQGITDINIDEPFKAEHPYTISSYIRRVTGVQCIQIEINSRLLFGTLADEYFLKVYKSLRNSIQRLTVLLGEN